MEGISLSGVSPGATAKPLKAITFTIIATLSGPSDINGYFKFNFGSILAVIVITGSRTMIFPFPPRTEMVESLEWLTDLITSNDGTERRDGARLAPRQEFAGEYRSTDRNERVRMAAILSGWLANTFSLPVWMQLRPVGSIAAGATTVMVDTAYADYRNGGFAALYENNRKAEILTIAEVLSDRLTLAYPVTRAYANAMIMPARVARITGNVGMGDTGLKAAQYQLKFEILDNKEVITAPSAVQYRGFDVLPQPYLFPSGEILERVFERDIRTDRLRYGCNLHRHRHGLEPDQHQGDPHPDPDPPGSLGISAVAPAPGRPLSAFLGADLYSGRRAGAILHCRRCQFPYRQYRIHQFALYQSAMPPPGDV